MNFMLSQKMPLCFPWLVLAFRTARVIFPLAPFFPSSKVQNIHFKDGNHGVFLDAGFFQAYLLLALENQITSARNN